MKSALLSSALIPIALFGGCDLPEPADPFAGLPPAAGGAQWQVDRGGPPPPSCWRPRRAVGRSR